MKKKKEPEGRKSQQLRTLMFSYYHILKLQILNPSLCDIAHFYLNYTPVTLTLSINFITQIWKFFLRPQVESSAPLGSVSENPKFPGFRVPALILLSPIWLSLISLAQKWQCAKSSSSRRISPAVPAFSMSREKRIPSPAPKDFSMYKKRIPQCCSRGIELPLLPLSPHFLKQRGSAAFRRKFDVPAWWIKKCLFICRLFIPFTLEAPGTEGISAHVLLLGSCCCIPEDLEEFSVIATFSSFPLCWVRCWYFLIEPNCCFCCSFHCRNSGDESRSPLRCSENWKFPWGQTILGENFGYLWFNYYIIIDVIIIIIICFINLFLLLFYLFYFKIDFVLLIPSFCWDFWDSAGIWSCGRNCSPSVVMGTFSGAAASQKFLPQPCQVLQHWGFPSRGLRHP